MKAIVCSQPGSEEVMRIADVPPPPLGDDEVRIRVYATSVNRADLLQRQGLYPPPPGVTDVLGLECSGEIVEVGSRAGQWKIGQRVLALLPGGGYAEEVVVHHGSVLPMPESFSWEEGGAFPEVFLTAFLNLFLLGRIARGGTALVHGGGSGVGTAAITLLKRAGVRVLVTAGSEEKCQRCLTLGADAAVNYRTEDFPTRVRELTQGTGVDVVLDHVGARYLSGNLECLGNDGRLVVIGLLGGAKAEINLALLLVKRLHLIGSTLRTRSPQDKARIVQDFLDRFGNDFRLGLIRPVIDRVFSLEEVAEAHRIVAASRHFGKVVLRVR